MVIKDIGSFTFYAVLFGTPSFPFSLWYLSEMSRRLSPLPNSQCHNVLKLYSFSPLRMFIMIEIVLIMSITPCVMVKDRLLLHHLLKKARLFLKFQQIKHHGQNLQHCIDMRLWKPVSVQSFFRFR
jgi:hypothetical protein